MSSKRRHEVHGNEPVREELSVPARNLPIGKFASRFANANRGPRTEDCRQLVSRPVHLMFSGSSIDVLVLCQEGVLGLVSSRHPDQSTTNSF